MQFYSVTDKGKWQLYLSLCWKTRTERTKADEVVAEVSETTVSHLQCSCARDLHTAIMMRAHHSE